MPKPRIAVTLGDPAGIGPEVALKALEDAGVRSACVPVLVGEARAAERALRILDSPLRLRPLDSPDGAADDSGVAPLLPTPPVEGDIPTLGQVSAEGGAAALNAIQTATDLTMKGHFAAVVTAPVNKEALKLAGCPFPGHTELLAHLTGAKESRMLLVAEGLRVAHNSTHVSLRRACDLAERDRVLRSLNLELRAPFPLGYTLEQGDWSQLDPVKARPPMWRKVT